MELREISAELHAEQVLPISAGIWAGRRKIWRCPRIECAAVGTQVIVRRVVCRS